MMYHQQFLWIFPNLRHKLFMLHSFSPFPNKKPDCFDQSTSWPIDTIIPSLMTQSRERKRRVWLLLPTWEYHHLLACGWPTWVWETKESCGGHAPSLGRDRCTDTKSSVRFFWLWVIGDLLTPRSSTPLYSDYLTPNLTDTLLIWPLGANSTLF